MAAPFCSQECRELFEAEAYEENLRWRPDRLPLIPSPRVSRDEQFELVREVGWRPDTVRRL